MQLRFYAKPGHCAHWPGLKQTGQAYAYVGRELVPGDAEKGVAASHPASKSPVAIDSDTDDGRRFAKLCRRGGLWPADVATAAYCGRDFVAVEFSAAESEWLPKPAKSSPTKDAS